MTDFTAVIEWPWSDNKEEIEIKNYTLEDPPDILILPDGRVLRLDCESFFWTPALGANSRLCASFKPATVARLDKDGTAYEIDFPSLVSAADARSRSQVGFAQGDPIEKI